MNLGKGEETVTVAAVIDKRRLQRRFDPCYLCEIDVASKLAFVFGFKIELLDLVSVHDHNTGFFRVGGIDKHFLRHKSTLHNTRAAARPGGARGCVMRLVRAMGDGAKTGPEPASDRLLLALARVIAFLLRYESPRKGPYPLFTAVFQGALPGPSAVLWPFPAQSACSGGPGGARENSETHCGVSDWRIDAPVPPQCS